MAQTEKKDFSGKVVLITGSSSGIGEATAIEFARRGALLTVTGRDAERVQGVADQCQSVSPTNHKPLTVIADLSDEGEIEKLFNATIERYGALHVLVNNAARMGRVVPFEYTALSDFDSTVALNMRAPFHLTKLAVPELKKTKGSVINVSSALSSMAATLSVPYVIMKSALDHFTRCIATDLAPSGVRVNAINPGYILTQLFRTGGLQKHETDELSEKVRMATPTKKYGTTEEVAAAIAFLASDEASLITGACLLADGAFHMAHPLFHDTP